MTNTNSKKLQQILDHYGEEAQREILIEECAELIQAAQKLKRDDSPENHVNYIEELADVDVMLSQMKLALNREDTIYFRATVSRKINRQMERIEKEEKKHD